MITDLVTKAKIAMLKRKVRTHYIAYHNALSSVSCGKEVAEHIGVGGCTEHKRIVNETLDELAKLDPTCPATRLD